MICWEVLIDAVNTHFLSFVAVFETCNKNIILMFKSNKMITSYKESSTEEDLNDHPKEQHAYIEWQEQKLLSSFSYQSNWSSMQYVFKASKWSGLY